jgi:hypothetical protein
MKSKSLEAESNKSSEASFCIKTIGNKAIENKVFGINVFFKQQL